MNLIMAKICRSHASQSHIIFSSQCRLLIIGVRDSNQVRFSNSELESLTWVRGIKFRGMAQLINYAYDNQDDDWKRLLHTYI